jgi:prepilin-type N-terminal cleavage/methylation domain-containing protein
MIESRHTSTSAITGKRKQRRRGFTLVELLMVIALIGMLSSAMLVALYAAGQTAKVRRTEQQVQRIHSLLMSRWESYQYRPLPIKTAGDAKARCWQRLRAIRELMRLEFPDRRTDVAPDVGAPITPSLTAPSLWKSYNRRVARLWPPDLETGNVEWHLVSPFENEETKEARTWTPEHQAAECLYMILANIREGDRNGLDFFTEDEIGDVDGDKMPEILDGWGKPINFLRWAPGFVGQGISDLQTGDMDPGTDGDSGDGGNILDPLKVDELWDDGISDNDPFMLVPLIFSAGPDAEYGIITEMEVSNPDDDGKHLFRYTEDSHPYPNNPFHIQPKLFARFGNRVPINPKSPFHPTNNPYRASSLDNISNHLLGQ